MYHCPHRLRRAHWCVAEPALLGVHRLYFQLQCHQKRWLGPQNTKKVIYHSAAWFSAMPTSSSPSWEVLLGLWEPSCETVRDIAHLETGETSANFIYQILLSEEFCMLYWSRKAGFTAFMHDCPFSSCMSVQLIYA